MKENKRYRYLIFDADHTLIDFDRDERRAIRAAFAAAGTEVSEDALDGLWRYSRENWQELGLHRVHLPEIQKSYHALHYTHVAALFEHAEKLYGLQGGVAQAVAVFFAEISKPSHLIDGAEETLSALSEKYTLCVATNGLAQMQRGRLQNIAGYFSHIFISEEMGTIKPCAAFFERVLNDLGATAGECLVVGDSLSSDIAGANGAGIDAVLYNPALRAVPDGVKLVAQISRLTELLELL